MWQVPGKTIDPGFLKPLDTVEILYDFEGPRTFTHCDRDGQLCLAHWCDADGEVNRFLVVPFTNKLVQKLKAGHLSLADALDQPRTWVVDLDHSGEVRHAWSVIFTDLPEDILPKAGTMLWPSLEPMVGSSAISSKPS